MVQNSLPFKVLFFSHASCSGERRKYAGKKGSLTWVSNSQPLGNEYNTLYNEPPGWSHDYDCNNKSDVKQQSINLNCKSSWSHIGKPFLQEFPKF